MQSNGTQLSISEKRARRAIVHEVSEKIMNGQKNALKLSMSEHPWLTRHMVNGCIRRAN